MVDTSLSHAVSLDAADPLRQFRDRFVIADDTVYLDGNSLGRLPLSTVDRMRDVVEKEWGRDLIRGWSHWIGLSRRVGDLLTDGVLDARPGEVILGDSTTVNLYKLAVAALDARPDRRVIITDDDNFPTDRYVFQSLASARGLELRLLHSDVDQGLDEDELRAALDDGVALVCLSHTAYRSGAVLDLTSVTAMVHEVGALMLWDLSHSAGSIEVPLTSAGADLAVGCTYKYLNGGPGSPGFLYVRQDLQSELRQPIWGWFGQSNQFDMGADYQPVEAIERFCVGTPPILATYAAAEGIAIVADAGLPALRAKGIAMTSYLIDLADAVLAAHGFAVASPRDAARRGSHVSLHHPQAWQLCQALIDRGVVPDFRTPERIRLGPAPLYTRYADVWHTIERLREIAATGAHLSYPETLGAVT